MKINIDKTTYIFLLISFLSGYFEYMYLFLLIVFIHESGHAFFGKIVHFNNPIITIYPFGGITLFNEDLNTSTNRELFSLLGGICFQLIFYLLCLILYNKLFITRHVFDIIKRINIILVSYNFMPILPLDGGRLLNIMLDKLFSYKLSNKITIIISISFIFVFLFCNTSLFAFLLSLFLIKCIVIEIKNINYKYHIFLFERYEKNYKFNKIKYIKNINLFKRDYNHIINNEFESVVLHKLFDRKY